MCILFALRPLCIPHPHPGRGTPPGAPPEDGYTMIHTRPIRRDPNGKSFSLYSVSGGLPPRSPHSPGASPLVRVRLSHARPGARCCTSPAPARPCEAAHATAQNVARSDRNRRDSQVALTHFSPIPTRRAHTCRWPGKGARGEGLLRLRDEGWVTSYRVCGHLPPFDSLSAWGHYATSATQL